MLNPTAAVSDEIQTAFLDGKSHAEMAGHGSTAYCWGLQAVLELLAERDANRVAGALQRAFELAKENRHNPIQGVIFAADEYGVRLR